MLHFIFEAAKDASVALKHRGVQAILVLACYFQLEGMYSDPKTCLRLFFLIVCGENAGG